MATKLTSDRPFFVPGRTPDARPHSELTALDHCMSQDTDSLLRLELFGVPSISLGSQRLHLSHKRAHAPLAVLALEGRMVPRNHLSSLLWPDVPAAVSRTRLRRLIYQIKEVCGRDLFERHEGGIALA